MKKFFNKKKCLIKNSPKSTGEKMMKLIDETLKFLKNNFIKTLL